MLELVGDYLTPETQAKLAAIAGEIAHNGISQKARDDFKPFIGNTTAEAYFVELLPALDEDTTHPEKVLASLKGSN